MGEEERVAGGLGLRPVDEAEEGCDEEQWGHVAVDSSRCGREHSGEGGNEAMPCACDAAEQGVRGVGGRFRRVLQAAASSAIVTGAASSSWRDASTNG